MLKALGWGLYILLIVVLTALTQVGGAILLFSLLVVWSIFPSGRLGRIRSFITHLFAFLALYGTISLLLVPPVAQLYGRVPLQCFASERSSYAALTPLTCALNRHYVAPTVADALEAAAKAVNRSQPGTVVTYLDASFPFLDSMPLLPHLSHRSGLDVDLGLFYLDASGRYAAGEARSPIGYFGFEQPGPEAERPCRNETGIATLRWDLDWLQPLFKPYRLDEMRTAELLSWLVLQGPNHGVSGLIIEPHLGARLGVHSQLIRFQGCKAARHDDHIHVDFN